MGTKACKLCYAQTTTVDGGMVCEMHHRQLLHAVERQLSGADALSNVYARERDEALRGRELLRDRVKALQDTLGNIRNVVGAMDEVDIVAFIEEGWGETAAAEERIEQVNAQEALEALILAEIPYVYDDGDGEEAEHAGEANAAECVGYAAAEIKDLRAKRANLQFANDEARTVLERMCKRYWSNDGIFLVCAHCGGQTTKQGQRPTDIHHGNACLFIAAQDALKRFPERTK